MEDFPVSPAIVQQPHKEQEMYHYSGISVADKGDQIGEKGIN
jgi:hypothetical protein